LPRLSIRQASQRQFWGGVGDGWGAEGREGTFILRQAQDERGWERVIQAGDPVGRPYTIDSGLRRDDDGGGGEEGFVHQTVKLNHQELERERNISISEMNLETPETICVDRASRLSKSGFGATPYARIESTPLPGGVSR
jgi:hypothetical protein